MKQISDREYVASKSALITFALAAASVPLFYSLYTGHIWEDFFITFRFSQNLAEGKGLIYNAGERVYGFTSPLGVLLPALFYILTGKNSYLSAVWLFRIISIFAFVGAGLLVLSSCLSGITRRIKLATVYLAFLYIFQTKAVVYLTNGMETAFILLFLAGYLLVVQKDVRQCWVWGGVCWSGFLWTRPDGFVYIFILALATILFSEGSKKEILNTLGKMSGLCAIVYLPWLVGTWVYYGSPIPQTISAKSVLLGQTQFDWSRLEYTYKIMFGPIYYFMGGWPKWLNGFSYVLGVLCTLYWMLPLKDRFGRMVSFIYFCLLIYLVFSPQAPWYFPPAVMLGVIIVVRGLFIFNQRDGQTAFKSILISIVIGATAFQTFYVFSMTTLQMKIQQAEVEEKNRKQIGLWLRDHVVSDETVYLEPLGYVGYFSGAKMLDFPGLVSPRVTQLLKGDRQLDFYTMVPLLQPDWIILRPGEAEKMQESEFFVRRYKFIRSFDVRGNLLKYPFIPGQGYLDYDALFVVYKKKTLSEPEEAL